jgi:hypothetical protein
VIVPRDTRVKLFCGLVAPGEARPQPLASLATIRAGTVSATGIFIRDGRGELRGQLFYNEVRPHQALGYRTPAETYFATAAP